MKTIKTTIYLYSILSDYPPIQLYFSIPIYRIYTTKIYKKNIYIQDPITYKYQDKSRPLDQHKQQRSILVRN